MEYGTFGAVLHAMSQGGLKADATAKELDRISNNMCFDAPAQIASLEDGAVAESKTFFWIAYYFLIGMQRKLEESWRYDGRNEYACKMADTVMRFAQNEGDVGEPINIKAAADSKAIAKYLYSTHPTIQQTFAKACFYYLEKYRDTKTYAPRTIVCAYARQTDDRDWWKMPLI